jgi:hypothetical protein
MALNSNGLTDIGQGKGFTTNFQVQYEDTLPNQANVIANANALLSVIETEFTVTTGWFATPAGKFGTGNRQVVNLNLTGGGSNSGYGSSISIDGEGFGPNATESVKMVFMNEWVEILMSLTGGNWNAGNSSGEGLSQYCGIIRFRVGHYSYYGSWVDQWLNKQPRQDWVTTIEGTDKDAISFGCALAFIFYLNTQLNFSINQIIAAGASNLATIYQTLTGDPGQPYAFFAGLIEHVYPSSATANIPGPVTDNPFPLAQLSFWGNKNTFGKDEVKDILNTSGGNWPKAFWLVVEGFSENSFNALGVSIPALTGPFANLTGISIVQNPAIDFENAANPQAPQRIRVPYDIRFTNAALNDFPPNGSLLYELDAFLSIAGTKIPGSDASTQFELVSGADPYFTNIDPNQNNVYYLSQDLRVFTAAPLQNPTPVAGAPAFNGDSVGEAYSYIQHLTGWLNDPNNHFTDGSNDPFVSGVIPQPSDALVNFSSITPFTYDFSNIFNIKIFNNYNFAVARVRLRGTAGPSGAAKSVRVFFRLWTTETPDADYQPATTYLSSPDAANLPGTPLVGADHITLPFFALGNLPGNSDYVAGGTNIRDIQIPTVPAGEDTVWAYYGCFLNLYDSTYFIDGKNVQGWLNGTHHCIVAQIANDNVPLFIGENPESSGKLAQRNLQVTRSDNPGPASTHRIPQTFDIRPSAAIMLAGSNFVYPDELMIDWGTIPAGSVASIYWPQVNASDVIALATQLYSTHTLSSADANTIQCKITGGVTYVPIPTGSNVNFAGLFTVDLPMTINSGQEFNVVVRRISTRQIPVNNLKTPQPTANVALLAVAGNLKPGIILKERSPQTVMPIPPNSWRYVVGTFQVKIPVTTKEVMLFPEENALAIMKWRLQQMATSDRWYPVLLRYITYIAARVDGLGGNSSEVIPSVQGVPVKTNAFNSEHCQHTGKVCQVIFDCFGDFEGFVLSDCSDKHLFKCKEKGIAEIVLRACKERLTLSVCVCEKKKGNEICKIIVQC